MKCRKNKKGNWELTPERPSEYLFLEDLKNGKIDDITKVSTLQEEKKQKILDILKEIKEMLYDSETVEEIRYYISDFIYDKEKEIRLEGK